MCSSLLLSQSIFHLTVFCLPSLGPVVYCVPCSTPVYRVVLTVEWSLQALRASNRHAPRNIPKAQCAFKVLMIHWILQFALRIAFRCVLHRWLREQRHPPLKVSPTRGAGSFARSRVGCPWGERGWRDGFLRPVLKHGPRSLTCVRVLGWQTLLRIKKWAV